MKELLGKRIVGIRQMQQLEIEQQVAAGIAPEILLEQLNGRPVPVIELDDGTTIYPSCEDLGSYLGSPDVTQTVTHADIGAHRHRHLHAKAAEGAERGAGAGARYNEAMQKAAIEANTPFEQYVDEQKQTRWMADQIRQNAQPGDSKLRLAARAKALADKGAGAPADYDPTLQLEPEPEQKPQPIEVLAELTIRSEGVLGLEFDNSWVLVGVDPGSLAAQQPAFMGGSLQLGMQLVRIADAGIRPELGDGHVFTLLQDAGRPLRMGFGKPSVADSSVAKAPKAQGEAQAQKAAEALMTQKVALVQAVAEERLQEISAAHDQQLAAAIEAGKDAAAMSIKFETERQKAEFQAELGKRDAQRAIEVAYAWNQKPLPYLAVSARRLTVHEGADLNSKFCGVLDPHANVVITRRGVATVAAKANALVNKPKVIVRLEFERVGNGSGPRTGWVTVEGKQAFKAVGEIANYQAGMTGLSAEEETRPAEGVTLQPRQPGRSLKRGQLDVADYAAAAERVENEALDPRARMLIEKHKSEEVERAAAEAEAAEEATRQQKKEPEPEPEPEPLAEFQTTDAELDYVLNDGEEPDAAEGDEVSKTGLLDELAMLEAELAAAGGDSMTETESVYTDISRGSHQLPVGLRPEPEQSEEEQLLTATGQLKAELAAIDAELKAEGLADDDDEDVDEAAGAEDEFELEPDAVEENLDHQLQAEEDHQFIMESFRSLLPVYPRNEPMPQSMQKTWTLEQIRTRFKVGAWSDSDPVELATREDYSDEQTKMRGGADAMKRKDMLVWACERLQRSYRVHHAKMIVNEKRELMHAARKIQTQFRGRTARTEVKTLRDRLGHEVYDEVIKFDTDNNGFIDQDEFKAYMTVVGEWGRDDIFNDASWDASWPIVCELMGIKDLSEGMSVETFVSYTNKYRRDKLLSDLKALCRPSTTERARREEKEQLEAELAKKKLMIEQKNMAQAAAKEERIAEITAKKAELEAKKAQTAAIRENKPVEKPQPPKQRKKAPAAGGGADPRTRGKSGRIIQKAPSSMPGGDRNAEEDDDLSLEPASSDPLNTSQPLTPIYTPPSSAVLNVASTRSISTLVGAAHIAKNAPRLRSFELTVASSNSPGGDGPAGAELFDGFRRVYVRARSVDTLLDCLFTQLKVDDTQRHGIGLVVSNAYGRETAVDEGLRALPGRATVRLVKQQ